MNDTIVPSQDTNMSLAMVTWQNFMKYFGSRRVRFTVYFAMLAGYFLNIGVK